MKSVKDLDIAGKKVFIRVDMNVPMDEEQNITDDIRIRAVLPTIQYALDNNASIIVASHMGRPGGKVVSKLGMKPVAKRLARLIGKDVKLAPDCVGPEVRKMVDEMKPQDIILLENLRFNPGEQKNSDDFAKELASYCDIYINNAFAVCHREHASVSAITKYAPESAAGFLLQKELSYFQKAMQEPQRPLVSIVGGSKVSSKLEAFENLLQNVDKIMIGGAMASTFLSAQGVEVGKSMVEPDLFETALKIIKMAKEKKIKLYLPVDAVVAPEINQKAETKIVPIQEIPEDWMILDIGPATSRLFQEVLYDAKTVIWNGPMGVFEIDAFSRGTISLAHDVANCYAMTIVGGGDTDVAIHKTGETERITYISTGGGAFLYLLEGKILPAVAALEEAEKRQD